MAALRTAAGLMIVDQRDLYADVFCVVLEEEGRDRYMVAVLTGVCGALLWWKTIDNCFFAQSTFAR